MTEIIDLENISEELDYDSVYGKDDNNNQRVEVEAPADSMLDVWVCPFISRAVNGQSS